MNVQKSDYKFHISVLVIYFICVFLYATYSYKCDLLFSVCGIQYLIYGFVFPSVYGILCIWKKEILKKLPNLNKTKFKYYTTAILYSLFALYVVSVPRKINFFRLDLIEFVNNFTDLCKKDLTNHAQKIRQNTKDESFKYLLDNTCRQYAHRVYYRISNKIMTVKQYHKIQKEEFKNTLYHEQYSVRRCSEIVAIEEQLCKIQNITEKCFNYGRYIAYQIKENCKDCSEDLIKQNLPKYRSDAKTYAEYSPKNLKDSYDFIYKSMPKALNNNWCK